VRDARCRAITNVLVGSRLTSTIDYVDGTEEAMSWELFTPDEIAERARPSGFYEIERCTWWDRARPPTSAEQRFQIVVERR
jgi:hypothetical protein